VVKVLLQTHRKSILSVGNCVAKTLDARILHDVVSGEVIVGSIACGWVG
jgi:hypothetical protein